MSVGCSWLKGVLELLLFIGNQKKNGVLIYGVLYVA